MKYRRKSREERLEEMARANMLDEKYALARRRERTAERMRRAANAQEVGGLAFPKSPRIVDEGALERYRADHPTCEYPGGNCEHAGWPHMGAAHHIMKRSAGGSDTPDNLISLCCKHHSLAHFGKITKDRLLEIKRSCKGDPK